MQVSATRKKTGKSISVEYDMPGNLTDLVKQFGDETVYSHAKGSLVVALQGYIRSMLDRDTPEAQIHEGVAGWKPGQRRQGKSPQERAREAIGSLSAEERAALLKEFRAATQKAA